MQSVLIVDDDKSSLESMSDALNSQGYEIVSKSNGDDALAEMRERSFDVVLTDLVMPDVDGMDILKAAKDMDSQAQIIMITGHGSIDRAVEAMRAGAVDFVEKPVSIAALREKVKKAMENQALRRQNIALQKQIDEKFGFSNIIGNSEAMHEVFNKLKVIAPTRANVLICGETGSGKELIARAIHSNSPRKNKPFIPINCAAISKDLLESELFGHEKGAFTGADRQRQGAFELANGGTLLLDEVSEMNVDIQAKFLRVIEDQEFRRLGGMNPLKVDVRIISSTNKDLAKEVKEGRFREDLYYRLKVVTIDIPPLRKRKADIPLLVNAFLQEFSKENNKNVTQVDREALDLLMNYDWPGNVRELRNCIESMVVMSKSNRIEKSDLPTNIRGAKVSTPKPIIQPAMSLEEVEKETIRRALEATNGNRTKAAEILKIGLRTLHRKIQKYGLK